MAKKETGGLFDVVLPRIERRSLKELLAAPTLPEQLSRWRDRAERKRLEAAPPL